MLHVVVQLTLTEFAAIRRVSFKGLRVFEEVQPRFRCSLTRLVE